MNLTLNDTEKSCANCFFYHAETIEDHPKICEFCENQSQWKSNPPNLGDLIGERTVLDFKKGVKTRIYSRMIHIESVEPESDFRKGILNGLGTALDIIDREFGS